MQKYIAPSSEQNVVDIYRQIPMNSCQAIRLYPLKYLQLHHFCFCKGGNAAHDINLDNSML